MRKKELKDYQGDESVIQYLDGYAWGITPDGSTICLGIGDAVKAAIANPKLRSSNPAIDQVIELERETIAKESETNGRQPKLKRPGAVRSRPIGAF